MSIIELLLNWFLPNHCVLCQSKATQSIALCNYCKTRLPGIENGCLQCGIPLPTSKYKTFCGSCLTNPPCFDHTIATFSYLSPIDCLISRLKFRKHLFLAQVLGTLLTERLKKEKNYILPELIIPIPLHHKRLQERGYNQALEIAKVVSHSLKIPIDITSTKRIKETSPQTMISSQNRYKNIKNAFCVAPILKANHVAIIDDVVTTGNTVNELSKVLRKTQITKIDVWCCARTILKN